MASPCLVAASRRKASLRPAVGCAERFRRCVNRARGYTDGMTRSLLSAVFAGIVATCSGEELKLPDPLVTKNGERVASADAWTKGRRAEVLELFRQNIYGRAPVGR